MNAPSVSRMAVGERREQLLDAATTVFARGGFHGTSTDSVVLDAGVSQPYLFRIFGTKLELFLQVLAPATDRLRLAFEAELDERPFDPHSDEDAARLGAAYNPITHRDLLQIIMHGCSAGGVDAIAEQSRASMADIFWTVRRTGWDVERCHEFVTHGMLMSVLFSMRAPAHLGESPELDALAECTFGDAVALL